MNNQVSGRALLITAFFTLFMAVMTFNLLVFPACAVDTMDAYGIGQAGLTTLASVTSVVGLLAGVASVKCREAAWSCERSLLSMTPESGFRSL
jgi:hypothetical protein